MIWRPGAEEKNMLEENEVDIETPDDAPDAGGDVAPDAEVPEWDGTLETLDTQPWAKTLPETAREHIKGQYERHTFYRGLVDADDQVGKLTQEIDGLRTSLGAEVTKYKTEAESWKNKHAEVDTEYRGFRSEVEQERLAEKDRHVRETYPDIYETFSKAETDEAKQDSAFAMFVRLVEAQDVPMDRAAKMVRAAFDLAPGTAAPAAPAAPSRPAERDVTPPASVRIQGQGGLNPAEAVQKPRPESPDEARRRVMAQIEAEEAAAGG